MTTISVFGFERDHQQLAGPFYQMHMDIAAQLNGLSWEAMWSLNPAVHAIVAYARPDSELCQSLSDIVNSAAVLDFVDGQFAAAPPNQHVRPPERRGAIRTSYKTWGDILAIPQLHVNDANAHQAWELINTISVDFHCNTDWFMSALKGTISLYVFYYLDSGKPRVRMEGFSDPVWDEDPWRPDFGAAGQVSHVIAKLLTNDVSLLQALLQNSLDALADDRTFSDLYTLPGTGITVNAPFSDNADNNVSVCLIPGVPPPPIP